MGFTLAVGVGQPVGGDLDRGDFSTLFGLNQHRRDWLGWRSLSENRPMIAVKLYRGRLDDVGVLPKACVSGIQGNGGTAVGRHGAGSHVNGVGCSQKGAVGLRL